MDPPQQSPTANPELVINLVQKSMEEALREAKIEVALLGTHIWPIETLLENRLSAIRSVREDASLLLSLCKDRDISKYSLKLSLIIASGRDSGTRLAAVIELRGELTGDNWESLYMLNNETELCLREVLLSCVKTELSIPVATQVCSLIARLAFSTRLNGWVNCWPQRVTDFVCGYMLDADTSAILRKRVLKIFSEWCRSAPVVLLSICTENKDKFHAAIIRYLVEWNPTVSMAALDATLGSLPHLRKGGQEDVFSQMLSGVRTLLSRAMDDEREDCIQESMDLLIDLARDQPDLLANDELWAGMMQIAAAENMESETIDKGIELLLLLAESGNSSPGTPESELMSLFFRYLLVIEDEAEGDESELFVIGREGIARLAAAFGEGKMLFMTQFYHIKYGSGADWRGRHAVVVAVDAILEGCSRESNMSYEGLQRLMKIALRSTKDQHWRVHLAALKLILHLFPANLQLYWDFKAVVQNHVDAEHLQDIQRLR
uniref:uncharacterized protein LOC122591634 n=1 Tax=Erigeron canadensis TaxID=72917 RepID=UPI001CB8FB6A|nr:uncharacterized protein LOC122591634 [Erigeron canadensis]